MDESAPLINTCKSAHCRYNARMLGYCYTCYWHFVMKPRMKAREISRTEEQHRANDPNWKDNMKPFEVK